MVFGDEVTACHHLYSFSGVATNIMGSLEDNAASLIDPGLETTCLKPYQTFTAFSQLPIELRLKIWELALPGHRCLTLARRRGSKSDSLAPPSLLHVCQESRTTAQEHYRLCIVPPSPLRRQNPPTGSAYRKCYVAVTPGVDEFWLTCTRTGKRNGFLVVKEVRESVQSETNVGGSFEWSDRNFKERIRKCSLPELQNFAHR